MAKAPEKDAKKDGKEKEKGAGGDEMIEKPREPLFSKNGLMVMIGSNVVVVVLVFVVVFFVTGSPDAGAKKPDMPEGDSKMSRFTREQEWLELDTITTQVAAPGGVTKMVRYDLLVNFAGGATEQVDKKTAWSTGSRQELLRGVADQVMASFELDDLKDQSFRERYSKALKERLNKLLPEGDQVAAVQVVTIRWDA